MRRLWSVACLTLKVLFRGGGGWALLLVLALVSAFIFMVCQADGELANELQLRSRYALTFGTTLLGVCVLWLACVSMRADIEAKRLHLLTSYPLHRVQIYCGKWLGLVLYAALGLAVVGVTVGGCCAWLMARWSDPAAVAALRAHSWRMQRAVFPASEDWESQVERRLAELQQTRQLPPEADLGQVRAALRDQLRRNEQLVAPDTPRTWTFQLGEIPRRGDDLLLRYRFYASDKRSRIAATWTVQSAVSAQTFTAETQDCPFATGELKVPLAVVPPDGQVTVTYAPRGNPELVFYRQAGVRLLYRDLSLTANLVRGYLLGLLHLAAVIAVGLTIGVAFTVSVASFVAGVLYALALTSAFFQGFLRELSQAEESGFATLLARLAVRLGTFFTTGLEPPATVSALTQGLVIGTATVEMTVTRWFGGFVLSPLKLFGEGAYSALTASGADLVLGFCLYLALAAGGGMWLLHRKELDRVH